MSAAAGPDIVTNNLVFHVDPSDPKCYSGGATCRDLTRINGNGTLTDITHTSDGAFYFNLFTSNIVFDRSFINITNSVTYSVLVELKNPGFSNFGLIISSINNEGGGIYIWNYGNVGFSYLLESFIVDDTDPLSNSDAFSTPSDYIDGQKFLITITIDGSIYKMYINNFLFGLKSPHAAGDVNSQSKIYLGYNPLAAYFANGCYQSKIYKSMIYNRPLTDIEILQNYNAMKGRARLS